MPSILERVASAQDQEALVAFYGFEEMEKNINSLDKKLAVRVIQKAMKGAGKVTVKKAKQLVPVREGFLKKSIRLKTKKPKQFEYLVTVYLTVKKGVGREWVGLDAKARRKKAAGQVLLGSDYKYVKRAKYSHMYAYQIEFGTSKSKAQPYMRPAIEQTKPEFYSALRSEIEKAWQKEVVEKGL